MTTAPPLPPLLAGRRASAVRRFPPGCGRHHNAAQPPQPADPSARAAAKAPSPTRQPLPAAHFPGTYGHDRGRGNGSVAQVKAPAAAGVTARRVSAVRRYPPGCGRGVAVSKPEALAVAGEGEGEADASELVAAVCNGVQKVALCESTLDHGDSDSNGWGKSGGDGGGAQEECGGRPWIVTGIMSVPFVPWALHGRRSLQRRKLL